MISIKNNEELTPIDLGEYGLDKDHKIESKIYFLGIRIWRSHYTRKLHMDNYICNKKSKVGFTKST